MPTSPFYQLNQIVEAIMVSDPKAMLDVGVGFGKYGVLAREYLEFWRRHDDYAAQTVRIDGVEAHGEYLTPVHDFVYSNVYRGDARDLVPTLPDDYDLTLAIDVLEHFPEADAKRLLDQLVTKSRNVLISVPRDIRCQGARFGNSYETHRYQWVLSDFDKYREKTRLRNHISHIFFIGPDAERVAVALRSSARLAIKERLRERLPRSVGTYDRLRALGSRYY